MSYPDNMRYDDQAGLWMCDFGEGTAFRFEEGWMVQGPGWCEPIADPGIAAMLDEEVDYQKERTFWSPTPWRPIEIDDIRLPVADDPVDPRPIEL